MKRKYHVVSKGSKGAGKIIESFCQANGQILLPLVDLIAEARLAVDEVIDQTGRSLIETILNVSAEQVAGEKTPGKASGEVRWHGRQRGRVRVADRQIKVQRPRLRSKAGGEVDVPAYQALREGEETGDEKPSHEIRCSLGQPFDPRTMAKVRQVDFFGVLQVVEVSFYRLRPASDALLHPTSRTRRASERTPALDRRVEMIRLRRKDLSSGELPRAHRLGRCSLLALVAIPAPRRGAWKRRNWLKRSGALGTCVN